MGFEERMTEVCGSFNRYALTFQLTENEDIRKNCELKRSHSFRVLSWGGRIAQSCGASAEVLFYAKLASLLHDYGRFRQYSKYRTFLDGASVDHALLGHDLLVENGVLDFLPGNIRVAVLHAIRLHNVRHLPGNIDELTQLLAAITRDADKLDIIELVLSYHRSNLDNPSVTLNLSSQRQISGNIMNAFMASRQSDYSDLHTFYDFAVAKLSWFYDLNFAYSRQEFLRRKYHDRIFEFINGVPGAAEIKKKFIMDSGENNG